MDTGIILGIISIFLAIISILLAIAFKLIGYIKKSELIFVMGINNFMKRI